MLDNIYDYNTMHRQNRASYSLSKWAINSSYQLDMLHHGIKHLAEIAAGDMGKDLDSIADTIKGAATAVAAIDADKADGATISRLKPLHPVTATFKAGGLADRHNAFAAAQIIRNTAEALAYTSTVIRSANATQGQADLQTVATDLDGAASKLQGIHTQLSHTIRRR